MARGRLALLTACLLLGAALRIGGLAEMRDLLDYDEAYYGLDALSLLHQPRLTPFFDANNGRESLWMYLLAPAIAIFEARPFALRLVAVFAGILTLAAVHALARELLGRRAALWAVGSLAVLYWHVHLSHLAFRVLLWPLIGALAFALLLRARRTGETVHWLLAGMAVGLLLYTYFGARLWFGLALLLQAGWFIRNARLRRGIALSIVVTLLIALPLVFYTLAHPDAALGRVGDQAALTAEAIGENLRLWLGAWLHQGSTYAFHNPVGRPILDLPLAILFGAGLVVLALWKQRTGLFIAALGLAAVLPSLLSVDAPHFLRAAGLVIPIALVIGAAARLQPPTMSRARVIFPALLVWAALNTATDFQAWMRGFEFPGGAAPKLAHTNALVAALEADRAAPLYLYNVTPDDPVLRFMLARFDPAPLPLFSFSACTAGPVGAFRYLAPLDYKPHSDDPAAQWAQPLLLLRDTSGMGAEFGYSVYRASFPNAAPVTLTDMMRVEALAALPEQAQPGQTLDFPLRFVPLQPLAQPYTLFVHLLREDALVAQADTPLCPDYPPTEWQVGQAITQRFTLPLPPDLPTGDYALTLGLYDSGTLARLGDATPLTTLRIEG